jgi:RNA polymerase sigma-70 factor (sigma-E family)
MERGRCGWWAGCGYRDLVSVGGEGMASAIPGKRTGSRVHRDGGQVSYSDGARSAPSPRAAAPLPRAAPSRKAPPRAAAPPPREPSGQDDNGFRDYVTARSGALLRTAYLLTHNQADAEDLVQAALAKTYQAWGRIADPAALDGYVRRAMVNTHISWWRRRRVEEYPTDDLPEQPVADHADDSELSDVLRRALDRLPSRMRAAVVLRYYEDLSEPEIAEILGISQGTVKSTVSRAVAKLRIDAGLQEE